MPSEAAQTLLSNIASCLYKCKSSMIDNRSYCMNNNSISVICISHTRTKSLIRHLKAMQARKEGDLYLN
jgi:hypothetical protein